MTSYGATPHPGPAASGGAPGRPRRRNLLLVGAIAALLVGAGAGSGWRCSGTGPRTGPRRRPVDPAAGPQPASPLRLGRVRRRCLGRHVHALGGRRHDHRGRAERAGEQRQGLLRRRPGLACAPTSRWPTWRSRSPTTAGVTKCGANSSTCHAFRAPPACAPGAQGRRVPGPEPGQQPRATTSGPAGQKNTEDTLDALGLKYTGPPGMITDGHGQGRQGGGARVRARTRGPTTSPTSRPPQALVKRAKAQADIVIVQAHVGAEGSDKTHVRPGTEYYLGENRGDSIAFGHAVVDAGADRS